LSLALAQVAWLAPSTALAAPQPQEEPEGRLEITAPRQGDTVRGLVQITGSALSPEFNNYTLEFGFDPNVDEQWFPVQEPVAQQVQDGTLGQWDTTIIADGVYQLRLRAVRNDGTFDTFTVTGITVSNAVPTVLPSIAPSLTPSATVGVPTPGPSPTPLIQQPPTRTPRPSATPGGPTLTPTPNPSVALTRRQTRQAVCRGAGLTGLFFLLLGAYAALRRYARADIRRWWRSLSKPSDRSGRKDP
jgi:hypothetical protein